MRVRAPGFRVAIIVGTRIVIIARHIRSRGTYSISTEVPEGTDIPVVARQNIVRVETSQLRVACVGRADLIVVAINRLAAHTAARQAVVARGTQVGIVTGSFVGFVTAESVALARVVGAGIRVIAGQRDSRNADAVLTRVVDGAGVPIGTRTGQVLVAAPPVGQTDVLGALVAVVAFQRT